MNRSTIIPMTLLVLFAVFSAGRVGAGTIKGKITVKGARDARNVVVYVDSAAGEFKPPKEHVRMDQKNLTFIPHVLPVIQGTTVEYLNSDDVLHNVFTPDKCAEKFNLGTWAKGKSKSYEFKERGCVSVMLCNVHPEMEAWIVVLQNPYYSKTGKDGVFTIENVPAGKYTLRVWHKKLKAKPVEIEVPAKGEITVDFLMKR
ncbi:MAG: carboxypeptidase regulatory-like domain-containing protein [bacterium]